MEPEELEMLISRCDDPDLSSQERAQLKAALENEPQAGELLAQYRRLNEALGQLPDHLESVDFERFADTVNEKIDSAERIQSRKKVVWRVFGPLAAAAAIVVVGLPWFFRSADNLHPVSPDRSFPVAAVTRPDLGQGQSFALVRLSSPEAMPARRIVKHISVIAQGPSRAGAEQMLLQEQDDSVGEVICYAGPKSVSKQTREKADENGFFAIFF